MTLEELERACIEYLERNTTPLTPIATLLRHLEQEGYAPSSSEEFQAFLRSHPLLTVIEPPGDPGDTQMAAAMLAAGLPAGPAVALKSRMPSPALLSEQVATTMEKLEAALTRALAEARGAGDAERARSIIKTLSRVQALQDRLGEFF